MQMELSNSLGERCNHCHGCTHQKNFLPITVIGSYPKPDYLKVPSWFESAKTVGSASKYDINEFNAYVSDKKTESERSQTLFCALNQVLNEQHNLGIDIPTDGELDRENYIFHHCRHLNGFDFKNLKTKKIRNGACDQQVPQIVSKISAQPHSYFVDEWKRAQGIMSGILLTDTNTTKMNNIAAAAAAAAAATAHATHNNSNNSARITTQFTASSNNNNNNNRLIARPTVKFTIPGPMTIADTVHNDYYTDEKELLWDLACAINVDVLRLVSAGIKYIQIDEPLFARYPEKARDIGFKCLQRCLKGVKTSKDSDFSYGINNDHDNDIITMVHICCGYTNYVNEYDYKKADNNSYVLLAEYGLDNIKGIDYISIEDAHSRVPLKFFKLIKNTGIVLGCVKVCRDDIETANEIVERVTQIVNDTGFNPKKLMLAPDCGLALLNNDVVKKKMNGLYHARNILQKYYANDGDKIISKL